jgi:hypothetical protein
MPISTLRIAFLHLAPCLRALQANRWLIDRARYSRETGLPLLVCNRTGIAGFGELQSTLCDGVGTGAPFCYGGGWRYAYVSCMAGTSRRVHIVPGV